MTKISNSITHDSGNSGSNKRFGYIAYGVLFLIIIFSTYLHHFQPQVLRVPSTTDVSTWQNHPFEQTIIYDRLTDAEREKIRAEGLPDSSFVPLLIGDIISIMLCLLCFFHALKHYGFWMASCFFIGSFVFTGMEESIWIIAGRFLFGSSGAFTNSLGEVIYGTYWFNKGGLWFFETQFGACIGWFFIAYSCVLTAAKVFPNMSLVGRAAVGGLIAMGIDLWLDPIMTSPEVMAWTWPKGYTLIILGIPIWNFVGWFMLIFLFAIFWGKLPEMEKKWGRKKASIIFFSICISMAFAVCLILLILWWGIAGSIYKFMGVQEAIKIPLGW